GVRRSHASRLADDSRKTSRKHLARCVRPGRVERHMHPLGRRHLFSINAEIANRPEPFLFALQTVSTKSPPKAAAGLRLPTPTASLSQDCKVLPCNRLVDFA